MEQHGVNQWWIGFFIAHRFLVLHRSWIKKGNILCLFFGHECLFQDDCFVPIIPLSTLWEILPQNPLTSLPASELVECLLLPGVLLPSFYYYLEVILRTEQQQLGLDWVSTWHRSVRALNNLPLSPRTDPLFWDAQGRGFLAELGEQDQTNWGPHAFLPKETASWLTIFSGKKKKNGERWKTKSNGVDWWQEQSNAFLRKQSLQRKASDPNSYFPLFLNLLYSNLRND